MSDLRRAAEFDRVLAFLHGRRVRLERVYDLAGHEREPIAQGGTNEDLLRAAYVAGRESAPAVETAAARSWAESPYGAVEAGYDKP